LIRRHLISIKKSLKKAVPLATAFFTAVFLILSVLLPGLSNRSIAAGSASFEQHLNIINEEFATYMTTFTPTNNSLGLVHWDADAYPNATVYFEVVIKGSSNGPSPEYYAELYDSTGTIVAGSQVKVCYGYGTAVWARVRSSAITLTDETDYSVRIRSRYSDTKVSIRAARLIVVQSDSSPLTATQSQVEIATAQNTTSASPVEILNPKYYNFDSDRFLPIPTPAFEASLLAPNPTIEQEISILDKTASITGVTTYVPTDNSLGLFRWDTDKYPGATVYFEAMVLGSSNGYNLRYYASLYSAAGAAVAGSEVYKEYANNPAVWTKLRSGPITLTDDTDYTVRIKTRYDFVETYVKSAKLIIIQTDNAKITATQSNIEVGSADASFTNTTYSELTNSKIYQYDQDKFSPTPESAGDIEFHASLAVVDAADSVEAELYNKTQGQQVAEITHTGNTSWTLKRGTNVDSSAYWNTSSDDEYIVRVKCTDNNGGGCSGSIANAKIAIYQNSSAGISALETPIAIETVTTTDSDSTYTSQNFQFYYNPFLDQSQSSFNGGTFNYHFEATMKTSAGTGYSQLINLTDNSVISGSEISTTSTNFELQKSGDITNSLPRWPNTPKNMDIQLKNAGTDTTSVSSASLFVEVTNLATSDVTAYADLYDVTGSAMVASSPVSSNSSSGGRARSGNIALTSGHLYTARVYSSQSGVPVYLLSSKIILSQSDVDGVGATEIVHNMINYPATDTDSTYTNQGAYVYFDPANFEAGALAYYFESVMKTSAGTAYAKLRNTTDSSDITSSEVTDASADYIVKRSSNLADYMPVAAKSLDTSIKNSASNTTTVSGSRLIILASDMANSAPDAPVIDNYNDGTWGTDNTPTLQFDLSDPNSGDVIAYTIQVDGDSDFSSPVVDYTEPSGSETPRDDVTYTTTALDDGQYYWRVKATDSETADSDWGTANSGAIAFGIDTSNPSAPGTPTSSSHTVSVWSSDNTVDVDWMAATDSGGSGIDGYSYVWDTTSDTIPDTSKDVEEVTLTATSSPLGDGNSHYFHVRAIDYVGHASSTVHIGPFFIDTGNPTGTITVNIGDSYTNSTTVTLALTADDDYSSSFDMMPCNNISFAGCSWETFSSNISWTIETGDGIKTVYVKFRDEALNESETYSDTITLDTTAPTTPSSLASTSHTTSTWSADTTVETSWETATDVGGSGVDGYSYIWDTTSDTTPDTTKDIEESTTTLTSTSLSDGSSHYLHIRAKDNADNWSEAVHLGPFKIDTTSPTGAVTINNNDNYTNSANVALSLVYTDAASGVTHYLISEDPNFIGSVWMAITSSIPYTLTGDDGAKNIYVKYRDAMENMSLIYNDTIILDRETEVHLNTSSGDLQLNGDILQTTKLRPTFTGTGETDATVTITINSDTIIGNTAVGEGGVWSWQPEVDLSKGEHTLTIEIEDLAGNTSNLLFNMLVLGDTQVTDGTISMTGSNLRYVVILGIALIVLSIYSWLRRSKETKSISGNIYFSLVI